MADWPAWFYGPNGEAEIFADAAAVPDGWADTPAAFPPAVVLTVEEVEFVSAVPEAAPILAEVAAKRGPGRPRKEPA